jgi:uncharacterized protein (TIGR02271 family)
MTTTSPQGPGSGHDATTAAEVVLSEEQLRVSTRTEVIGRVRVRKQVTSEEVAQTVTLRREELLVEDLPLDGTSGRGADGALDASAAGDEEFEVVLHEERLVVVTVPVERVRVRVHRVTEEVAVSEVVRRERIALDVSPSAPVPGDHGTT